MDGDSDRAPRIFIDEHRNIVEGEEAAALIAWKADGESIDPRRGVIRVSNGRWAEAQRYERRTWHENGRRAMSDRNEYHRERFAKYACMRGQVFANAIELGCGPFTNIRFILEACRIEHVHLLDPLVNEYLRHPFCEYARHRLGGLFNERLSRVPGYVRHPHTALQRKLNDARIGGLLGRPVEIEPSTIEAYESASGFDLVVMVNVLEHCHNADAVLAKIVHLLVPGGVLVFHERVYKAEEVRLLLSTIYDAGHPLRVDQSVIDGFLTDRFEPLMRAEYFVQTEFHGLGISDRELYYIGKKRQGTPDA